MRQLLIFFIAVISIACSCTALKDKDSGQSNVSDSVYIKKGYNKYESKHNFSFYYSNIWEQLDKTFFQNAIKASFKELEPTTDYEAGFTLSNDKHEYVFPRFHLETSLTVPPSMMELKKMFKDYDLVKVFEDEKKTSWNDQMSEQVKMLSNVGIRIDEKKHIAFATTTLKVDGQGDLYCLSVLFLGKSSIASMKFFFPLHEKDKYLLAATETIDSFHYDKGYEFKD